MAKNAFHNGFQIDRRLVGMVEQTREKESFCSIARKIMYTQKRAGELINSAKHHQNGRKKHIERAYYCKDCGMWHLTHLGTFSGSNGPKKTKDPYKRTRCDWENLMEDDA